MLVSEEQVSADSLATAAIVSDDPHAVLVEFSSVVADTQEYIIRVRPFIDGRGGLFSLWIYYPFHTAENVKVICPDFLLNSLNVST
jgi:hypothetical protein